MSITPASFDFKWVRGTTAPLIVQMLQNSLPLPYDDVRLSVYNGKVLAWRLSLETNLGIGPGKVQVTSPGTFKFTPTAAQTRALTQVADDGRVGKSRYEVELRNGVEELVYLMGVIQAIGGLNDDEVI